MSCSKIVVFYWQSYITALLRILFMPPTWALPTKRQSTYTRCPLLYSHTGGFCRYALIQKILPTYTVILDNTASMQSYWRVLPTCNHTGSYCLHAVIVKNTAYM